MNYDIHLLLVLVGIFRDFHTITVFYTMVWGKKKRNIYSIPHLDFPGGSDGKVSAYNAGDPDLIPGLGRSPGEGNGNPLQYSCLKNPMDGGA